MRYQIKSFCSYLILIFAITINFLSCNRLPLFLPEASKAETHTRMTYTRVQTSTTVIHSSTDDRTCYVVLWYFRMSSTAQNTLVLQTICLSLVVTFISFHFISGLSFNIVDLQGVLYKNINYNIPTLKSKRN